MMIYISNDSWTESKTCKKHIFTVWFYILMHPDCDDKDEIMKASPHREWSMITTSCCISKAGGFVQHNLIMTWFDIKFRRKNAFMTEEVKTLYLVRKGLIICFQLEQLQHFAQTDLSCCTWYCYKIDNCHKKTLQ